MPLDSQRVQAIFAAAIDLSNPADRPALLDRECGNDAELRRRVEVLLAEHDDSADLPAAGDPQGTGAFLPQGESTELAPGTLFAGRYKVREKLGEGGMGTVYVADQTEPVARRVALKIIKSDIATERMLARFEQERQALALMDHPNIAKVFDAGVAPQAHGRPSVGVPYFVMELIKGVPITKYCDDAKLSPKQRLELFIPVCQAIQHAHQKGIIHRDLKPSNILIGLYDGRPVPKVIDFGVAKATGPRLTDQSIYTEVGALIGTLEYMSPEQAELNNLDIDTRSDIYALGVLLYELLTGVVPLSRKELKIAGFAEMLRIIKEMEPQKPSTRVSGSGTLPSIAAVRQMEPRKLTALLRNDLDWVVMKALEKDRSRRYETANGFAMDIQRYLADEPVLAGPPSAGYRVRKFVRRNRPQVIAASLILFALVAGIVGTTIGLLEARKQERLARDEATEKERQRGIAEANEQEATAAKEKEAKQRAKAVAAYTKTADVLDVMVSEITGDSLATQKTITPEQKKFLTEVLTYYREFAAAKGEDERTRVRIAKAAFRVGQIEYRLWRKEESVAAYRQARDEFARLLADFPAMTEYRQQLLICYNKLGFVLADLGRPADAEAQHGKALAIREKLATENPAEPKYRQELANGYYNFGWLLQHMEKWLDAEVQQRKGLAIRERLAAEYPAEPRYRQDLASSCYSLGSLLPSVDKLSEGIEQSRKGLTLREQLVAEFTTMPDYRRELAGSHINLGVLVSDPRNQAETEVHYKKAAAILEKLAYEYPAEPNYRVDLALCHHNLGFLLSKLANQAEAEEHRRKLLTIREKLVADFPTVPKFRVDLGVAYRNFAAILREEGKLADSLAWCEKAIIALRLVYEAEPQDVIAKRTLKNSYEVRAKIYDRLQKYAEAAADWDRVVEFSLKEEQPNVAIFRAISKINAGKVTEAIAEAVELHKRPGLDWYRLYSLACVYSIASGKSADKKQEYADRAMELLHEAVKAGYKDGAHMAKDTDLDPLRGREDFNKLLADLEKTPKNDTTKPREPAK